MNAFHDVRLPLSFSLGARGNRAFLTQIVPLASGREFRNSLHSQSRRSWDIGTAVKTLDDFEALVSFFEARRGRFHGFRFRDITDWKSCSHDKAVTALDQKLADPDGNRTAFPLIKRFESAGIETIKRITRPVGASILVAFDSVETSEWELVQGGMLNFPTPPAPGTVITAGFEYDLPVRFDTDQLEFSLISAVGSRLISVPVIELFEEE